MKGTVAFWCFSLLLCCSGGSSREEGGPASRGSFLWQIDDGSQGPPSYFFGTIHVPYTRVWDAIPNNTKAAFEAASQVFFELDLTSPRTLSQLSQCQLLPPGQHISEVIPTDLYMKLRMHLDYVRKAMPGWLTKDQLDSGLLAEYLFPTLTANWERKHPIWVVLMVNSLTKSDIASRGFPVLDLHLSQLATRRKKYVGAIEQVEEQCGPLNALNRSQVIFALNQTLLQAENVRLGLAKPTFSTDELIRLYRTGELDAFYFKQDALLYPHLSPPPPPPSGGSSINHHTSSSNSREPGHARSRSRADAAMAEQLDEYFKRHMIVERNKRMAARVIDLLLNNRGKSYFFAFGAAHFLGNNGTILDIVRSAGFKIKHLSPGEHLDRHLSHSDFSANTVEGTFDDLPPEEKTRAFLQFLQYHQQQQQMKETEEFRQISSSSDGDYSQMDERVVEESLKIWYGITNRGAALSASTTTQLPVVTVASILIFILLRSII